MKSVEILKNTDPKKWKELADRLQAIADQCVVVGIPASGNARSDDPIGSAGLLAVHEFGSPERNIPERSVVRRSIRENRDKYVALNAKNLRAVLHGDMELDAALNTVGLVAAGDVKATIRNAELAPLSEETIKRKGSSKPLIDTAQMIQSIIHEVRGD